jgi:hypothetical protein
MTLSKEAQEYWMDFFVRQAFDKRYAAYRGLTDKQKAKKLSDHLAYFFTGL